MSEFPKLARERLAAQQQNASGTHPDADLLGAFAEQSLSGAEREQVVAHLAACPQCRQVLALAFPALEPPEPARAAEVSRAWHEWWVFRWGGLAAALAVILIAVYLARPRARMGQEAEAPEKTGETIGVPVTTAPPAVPPPAEQKRAPQREAVKKSDKGVSRASRPTPREESNVAVTPEPQPRKAPAGAAADQTVEVQAARPAPMAGKMAEIRPPSPVVSGPALGAAMGGVLGRPSAPAKARPVAAITRWSISESGAVQRSDDGGRTWNDVDVAGATKFRTVAATGPDVWAGGARGELFHSVDAGDHWTRVAVRAGERLLTGDITRIELSGPTTVQVLTSTGEKWASTDAGATWMLLTDLR